MPGDAPESPAAVQPPTDSPPAPDEEQDDGDVEVPLPEAEEVTSLQQIVAATEEAPPKPDPIVLRWFLPPSKAHPKGRFQKLSIETRYPKDVWLLGIRYQTDLKQKIREKETKKDGSTVLKHPLADLEAIAQEVIVKPTWLHTESNLQRLKEVLPSPTFAELRRKLMLTAGLDGDFFADYQRLVVPQSLLLSAYESRKGSGSTPPPSTDAPPETSPPGTSTTGRGGSRTAGKGSKTTSGS